MRDLFAYLLYDRWRLGPAVVPFRLLDGDACQPAREAIRATTAKETPAKGRTAATAAAKRTVPG
jgi:hypothetical protein